VVAERGDRFVREALEAAGYSSLDSQLIAPLSLLYVEKQRPSDMATALGVSPGYATKLLNRLEKSGYIERTEDAADRRTRRVQLSPAGRTLIGAALEKLKAISLEHRTRLGDTAYHHLLSSLATAGAILAAHEQRSSLPPGLQSELSAVSLSAVSELVQRAIGRMNAASGYGQITLAHWRVLHDLGLSGSTNAALAEKQALSTQAISRSVREILGMGYIESSRDKHDGRVSKLVYSERGFELLASTADNIAALGNAVSYELPEGTFAELCQSLSNLYEEAWLKDEATSNGFVNAAAASSRLKSEFSARVDSLATGESERLTRDSIFSVAELEQLDSIINAKLR